MPPSPPSPAPIVTRFAPSPTGHLHIGGARTALFCWAYAHSTGGRFMIRIEDTDQARSSEASARGILEDLAWLNIDWHDGPALDYATPPQTLGASAASRTIGGDSRHVAPYYQSQRLDIYNRVLDDMIDKGAAYADFTSAAEIDALRKSATASKETFRYRPAESAILPVPEQRRRIAAGESHVVRLRAPQEAVRVIDQVLGEVAFAAGEVDDFVLRKADGFPTYHFGVVVDDELMGVTHVLRGQEHLMNTPKHAALQKALGYRTPTYAHMPLIFNEAGAKMSKRERDQTARAAVKKAALAAPPAGSAIAPADFTAWLGDTKRQLETEQLESLASALNLTLPEVSVDDFRKAGYLPEVITNFIALLGWNPGLRDAEGKEIEKFDMAFLAQHFAIDRIGKTNARFDRKKLLAFNTDALTKLPIEAFAARFANWCRDYDKPLVETLTPEQFTHLCAAIQPRSKTFRDASERSRFALTRDEEMPFDPKALQQHIKAEISPGAGGAQLVADLRAVLAGIPVFSPVQIHQALEAYAAGRGLNLAQISQPLRVAATGSTVSPPIDLTLAILGRDRALRRMQRCLDAAK